MRRLLQYRLPTLFAVILIAAVCCFAWVRYQELKRQQELNDMLIRANAHAVPIAP